MTENEAIELIEKDLKLHSKDLSSKYKNGLRLAIQCLEDIQQYRAIGTIEEFKALKEKAEPKKPILNNPKINEFYETKLCPACHSYINNYSGDYCRYCGQKLDWSE